LFGDSGNKLFNVRNGIIYGYDLSTPYDISTASYSSESVTVGSAGFNSNVNAIRFNSTGTQAFVLSVASNGLIQEGSLSVAWDVSTLTSTGDSYNIGDVQQVKGMVVNPAGTKIITTHNDNDYRTIDLSSGWDITSVTSNVSFSPSFDGNSQLYISPDGSRLYMSNYIFVIQMITLVTPWDITTGVDAGATEELDVSGSVTGNGVASIVGIDLKTAGGKLIVTQGFPSASTAIEFTP
jgi:hypothetical protein